jgi:hypothetical protein
LANINTSQLAYLAYLIGPIKTHQAVSIGAIEILSTCSLQFSEPGWENSYKTDWLKRFFKVSSSYL